MTKGSAIHAGAKQNLIDYENYKAERNRHKQQPPVPPVKPQASVSISATNREYRRWFRRTRRSTRAQGYFHYSGDDQELAKMTSFAIPNDFAASSKSNRRLVSSGKAPASRGSTSNTKKRRRSTDFTSDENEGTLSVGIFVANLHFELISQQEFLNESEASDGDIPLVQLSKQKEWAPVSRPKKKKKKDTHVEGPPKKKLRVDPQPKLPTPPPDTESSDVGVSFSKQKKLQVVESSSDEEEPLATQARKNNTQTANTGMPAQVASLNSLN
jgi:hypothetical protein